MQSNSNAVGAVAAAAAAPAASVAALSKRPLEPGFAFDGLDPTSFLVRY